MSMLQLKLKMKREEPMKKQLFIALIRVTTDSNKVDIYPIYVTPIPHRNNDKVRNINNSDNISNNSTNEKSHKMHVNVSKDINTTIAYIDTPSDDKIQVVIKIIHLHNNMVKQYMFNNPGVIIPYTSKQIRYSNVSTDILTKILNMPLYYGETKMAEFKNVL